MSKKIRVAIIGVGNCASSLVQGVHFYRNAKEDEFVPGLMHVSLGGYHVRDIEFTAAFDVNHTKVGKDLSEAIFAEPNNTIKFSDVPELGVKVHRGMTHDGLGKYLEEVIIKAPGPTDDIVQILKDTKTDVVINYLPVGSEMATKWYVEQVLEAGCGFINCIPVFIASQKYWQKRFQDRRLPIIGDDIKSQVGATITHRILTNLFREVVSDFARLVTRVQDHCGLKLILGNHDRGLKELVVSSSFGIEFHNCWEVGRFLLVHGNEICERQAGNTTIMGHEHPAISLGDNVRAAKFPCFVHGDGLMILPAFSHWASGSDIRAHRFMSPLARQAQPATVAAILGGRLLRLKWPG